jgi:membrane-bound lytic murein transglycosylase D
MFRLFVILMLAGSMEAAEGISDWHRLLDEMLANTEGLTASEPASTDMPSPDVAMDKPAEPMRPFIQRFVQYFSGPGRHHFDAAVQRLAPHREMIEQTFDQEGVPRRMIWLGLVESGFRTNARSPKQAVGMWQFMRGTAAQYGLIHGAVDDRQDPVKSTRAAAQYLRFLYNTFGDWPLALAAYNGGENRVATAIRKSGMRDFWSIAPWLPRETQAYVPAILAVQLLAGEADEAPAAAAPSNVAEASRTYAPFSLSP